MAAQGEHMVKASQASYRMLPEIRFVAAAMRAVISAYACTHHRTCCNFAPNDKARTCVIRS